MTHLKLRLFGGFEAALPSGAPISLPTKKAQALLAYCALRPGQAHQREKLATLLWGDTEECNARNSLRQTLFVLRTALRGNLSRTLRIAGDTVATEPQTIDVDVLAFERLAAERTPQALEQAAALYRGDLLEGFIVDEESFEQWLIEERERLRELAIEVLARLLRCQDAPGMTEAAVQTARRLLVLDPLQEAVHRLLMRLHGQAGRREAAMRQYEVCVNLLRRELRLEPEPETRQLYEAIQKGQLLAPATAARRTPDAGPLEIAAAVPPNGRNGANGAGDGVGSRARGEECAGQVLSPRLAGWPEYHARMLRAKVECEKARQLKEEIAARNASLRRAVAQNGQFVKALKTLAGKDVSGPSLVFREVSGDPPFSYSATGSG